jgi:Enterochelin esterase and related enzymes
VPARNSEDVLLSLRDASGRLSAVRLVPEFDLGQPLDFVRSAGRWQLRLARPAVDRMEYLIELADHNEHRWTITDRGNPLQAPGAFGPKSVLEFAGYQPPDWLSWPQQPASTSPIELDAPALDAPLTGELWAPDGLPDAEPAPLLIVHDGPEFAALGGLTGYLGAGVARGVLPPLRAALLGPDDRNGWYSANDAYARALGTLLDALPPATVRVGVGASLGALAMLHFHAHARRPLDALLLQSGSFFMPALDPQERDFSGFAAVTAFVAGFATRTTRPVPTTFTCGAVEENLANNRSMAATLRELGYPVTFVEVADAHNFTAWRDALHPQLADLLSDVAAGRAA